jgi:hypothetical protein
MLILSWKSEILMETNLSNSEIPMAQEEDNGLSTGVIIRPNGPKDYLTFWVKKWEMTVPSG